jgi:hypothetical protein
MLVKKEVKTQFEYAAYCDTVEEAIEFEAYLSKLGHAYFHRKDKDVFYLCSDLKGLSITKPFIKSRLEEVISDIELTKSKDKKPEVIDMESSDGV